MAGGSYGLQLFQGVRVLGSAQPIGETDIGPPMEVEKSSWKTGATPTALFEKKSLHLALKW